MIYQQLQNGTICNGDCLELMKTIPDKFVDMILCDLPYGTTVCKWDTIIPFEPLWKQYKRIIKDNGAIVLTASQPFTSVLGASNIDILKYSWVWKKSRPTNFTQAKRMPLKGFEDILVFYSKPTIYNPQDTVACDRIIKNTGTKSKGRLGLKTDCDVAYHGVIVGSDENDCYSQTLTNYPRGIIEFAQESKSIHPTQKPVALFEYLIKTYTNEGELVLDNCSGSGTTAIACLNTNRKYICMEMDEGYYEKSIERVRNHKCT